MEIVGTEVFSREIHTRRDSLVGEVSGDKARRMAALFNVELGLSVLPES